MQNETEAGKTVKAPFLGGRRHSGGARMKVAQIVTLAFAFRSALS